MAIRLSDSFDYKKLLRFTLPSIFMMILVSLYCIVDGLFVSNLVGENAFSAVNIAASPVYMLCAIGHMVGMGGGAVVARTLGEKQEKEAGRYFTMIVLFAAGLAVVFSALGIIFVEPIMLLAGASELILDDCISYGTILFIGMPLCILQGAFSRFLSVLEKPKLALYISIAAGLTNMVLDYVFISPELFDMGIEGAALATIMGYAVGGLTPVIYVFKAKNLNIHFVKTGFEGRILKQTVSLGASTVVTDIAGAVSGMVFNNILMSLAGESGVAAYGVILYLDFMIMGLFNGFSVGIAPIVSYHYGAQNRRELHSLMKKAFVLMSLFSLGALTASELLSQPIAWAFVKSEFTLSLAVSGIRLYSLMYIFCGTGTLIAALFSALSNGRLSFSISMIRTVLRILFVFLLSWLWGINGVWFCGVLTEALVAAVSIAFFAADRKKQKEVF